MSESARNTIIEGLQAELWNVEWDEEPVKLVERNLRRMMSLEEMLEQTPVFPAIWILDFPDEVEKPVRKTSSSVEYQRSWGLGVTSFFAGSTEDAAPTEIEEFQDEVRKALYRAARTMKVSLLETVPSENSYPELGNNVIVQTIQFDVGYVSTLNF